MIVIIINSLPPVRGMRRFCGRQDKVINTPESAEEYNYPPV